MSDIGIDYDNEHDENFQGYRRKYTLRDLKYFDVGISFLSDSLHNCYHDVAVSKTICD